MLLRCDPPWLGHRGGITFRVDLPVATRQSDPPAVCREAALRAIADLPHPDVTIWSDGSARGRTEQGGAGALIQFHHLNREETVRAPAGAVCSSLRAELTAMREAFAAVAGLEDGELASTKSVRLLTDSRSGLQLLGRGPANQTMALAAEVWRLLSTLAENGTETVLQWVPGHAGLDGNETADRLAGEATAGDQDSAPIDLSSDDPPSYNSLFGQIREAKDSSSGLCDFMLNLLLMPVGCLVGLVMVAAVVGLVFGVPITLIVVGSLFLHDCPITPGIPIWMVTGGCVLVYPTWQPPFEPSFYGDTHYCDYTAMMTSFVIINLMSVLTGVAFCAGCLSEPDRTLRGDSAMACYARAARVGLPHHIDGPVACPVEQPGQVCNGLEAKAQEKIYTMDKHGRDSSY
ncbi:Ribonuclease H [Amphibalanus amphitrite]|uniref:Ribonuclease H n=1 Tax=Amphibalanus amphitrite TaxID=1232801 RepID=A0A6A4WXT5_AMPAM|nr:Ribonuclease H [Amphibalanus amphitrite]